MKAGARRQLDVRETGREEQRGVPGREGSFDERGGKKWGVPGAEDIFDCDAGNFTEGLVSEERLMSGDQDVGEHEEAGQFVVLEDRSGQILEKDPLFLLVDVQGNSAEAT